MKNLRIKSIAILTSLVASTSHAIVNGSVVEASDYRDFTVRVINSNNIMCGGTMLTPTSLLTAEHCFDTEIQGDTISLIQGEDLNNPIREYNHVPVVSYNLVTSVEHACDAQYYIHEVYNNQVVGTNLEGVASFRNDWGKFDSKEAFIADCETNFDEQYWKNRHMPDLVLVKLGASVVMETSPLLRNTGDANEVYLPYGTEVMARGWGKTESGEQSTRLKQASLMLTSGHYEPYKYVETEMAPDVSIRVACDADDGPLDCDFDPLNTDQYTFKDADSYIAPGDSGSPLFISNNEVIGLTNSVRHPDRDESKLPVSADYAQFAAYSKFMLETVNDLVMPSHVIADPSAVSEYEFTVQNLSPTSVPMAMAEGEIQPGLTLSSDCGVALASNADCKVSLTVDVDLLGLTPGNPIEVAVSDERSVLVATVSDEDSGTGDDGSDNDNGDNDNGDNGNGDNSGGDTETPATSSGGSSGGSVSFFTLMLLGLFGLRRKV
ncbi:trypsin-like serine protease [Vibrio owensii]|uniref:trypsin-like serine protease n=1 Tax=Vibrio owensii TaxID=696485 RepID=UPI0018F1E164|nr:trypsin-like serine protease [Vibrio owensii]